MTNFRNACLSRHAARRSRSSLARRSRESLHRPEGLRRLSNSRSIRSRSDYLSIDGFSRPIRLSSFFYSLILRWQQQQLPHNKINISAISMFVIQHFSFNCNVTIVNARTYRSVRLSLCVHGGCEEKRHESVFMQRHCQAQRAHEDMVVIEMTLLILPVSPHARVGERECINILFLCWIESCYLKRAWDMEMRLWMNGSAWICSRSRTNMKQFALW